MEPIDEKRTTKSHLRAEELHLPAPTRIHYERCSQGEQALAYAEAVGWMPDPPEHISDFDEIPNLVQDYGAGEDRLFFQY
jgi:hypothetical protein